MRQFYYFSKSRLKFIEIRNFPRKVLLSIILLTIVLSSLLFGGFFLFSSLVNSDTKLTSLKTENKELAAKLTEMIDRYEELSDNVDSLSKMNRDLRIAADLPPVSDDEMSMGTGGGMFDNILNLSEKNSNLDLDQISGFLEFVENKISYERSNYLEISNKLKTNQKLFASIPAIKPSEGLLSNHGFGMRIHPILNINRMHEGIDIITDIGTPVVAPGAGTIDFVGNKSGYGLCVEIDHGFGYRTVMGHLSSANVSIGKKVKRGDLIARTGNSGLSTGPHLHYEVHHNGMALDPMGFIFDDLGVFQLSVKK